MGIAYNPSSITNNLILCNDAANLKSYPGTGVAWNDISGNRNNATLVNGVSYSSTNGGAMSFDGLDDHVTFASNPVLTNQITVELWVKLSNSQGPNADGWLFGREGCYRSLYTSNRIDWICATANNAWYTTGTVISATSISPYTETYQVTCTYDGANLRIYINGALNVTGAAISGNIVNNAATYNLMRPDAGSIDYGQGIIYMHRVYDRALTGDEILQNFAALRGRYGI